MQTQTLRVNNALHRANRIPLFSAKSYQLEKVTFSMRIVLFMDKVYDILI